MTKSKESWDPVWEKIFQKRNWGKYPEIPVVRFIAKNFYNVKNRYDIKIVDIGCAEGKNVWYLAREGFNPYGIDGSPTAIKKAKGRLEEENLKGNLQVGDVISLPYENEFFDAVIDDATMQHNNLDEIRDYKRSL